MLPLLEVSLTVCLIIMSVGGVDENKFRQKHRTGSFFPEFAWTVWNVLFGAYMVINCSSLPSDNDILLLPFFGGNYPIFLLCIIY